MAGCSCHLFSHNMPSSSWVLDARYRSFHGNESSNKNFVPRNTIATATRSRRNWLKYQTGSLRLACLCCRSLLASSSPRCAGSISRMCDPCFSPTILESRPPHKRVRSSALVVSFAHEIRLLRKHHNRSGYKNRRWRWMTRSQVELASGMDVINNLGLDTLTFLTATVFVVPTFKAMKASPILGFLLSGVVLNQLGLIHSVTDIKALSELGILFLLFEMGLELSLARLKALAKFAFGMGLAQVFFSTLAFTAFELPPNGAVGTRVLEWLFHARPDLVNIRTVDEAVVIGAALSLSSSAFVLQLLAEKGELPTRFGSATLGILLLQDIAVVPLLVILPILESGNLAEKNLWPLLAAESLRALAGLGAISLGGRLLLRRVFEIVANSRSSEAFVALCLLTVTGTSFLTQKLGFSDTLGAFLAGALLAETNYRTQVESDIRPFRGLLLGLFFVTTGTSIDLQLLLREWPNVMALLAGLIAIKTAIITAIGPRVGLSLSESVRTGLLLSQGGEFAFVVFSLANRLGVLPLELNRLLIIVVVLSMALTPFLNELGRKAAEYIEIHFEDASSKDELHNLKNYEVNAPVVIIGFGPMGQVLANFLSTPLAAGLGGDAAGWPYVAFDLDPGRVKAARKLGFPVLYGDGSRPEVLATAGISMPKAVMVMYTGRQKSVQAVERIRLAFPHVSIYARAQDLDHLLELKQAGATDSLLENTETSLQLGSVLLRGLGVMSNDVSFLRQMMRESMELRAQETLDKKVAKDSDWLVAFQTKVRRTWKPRSLKDDLTASKDARLSKQPLWAGNTGFSDGGSSSTENRDKDVDRELPLLFSGTKFPGQQEVDLRGNSGGNSGAVNGTGGGGGSSGGVAQDDMTLSSSTVAVAGPTGTIMEQEPQTGRQQWMDKKSSSSSEPRSEARTVTVRTPLVDTAPDGGSSSVSSARMDSAKAGQPASLAISKLKWRRRKGERHAAAKEGEDERGVTLCALTDDNDDERYKYKLEDPYVRDPIVPGNDDYMERIDETIATLERDESN